MSAQILDGKALSKKIRARVKTIIAQIRADHGVEPTLAIVRAGDDPASVWYTRTIARAGERAGIRVQQVILPGDISEAEMVHQVAQLSQDDAVHGIILQEPYPESVNPEAVVNALAPEKDIDGVHPLNAGLLLAGRPRFVPATPLGGLALLKEYDIPIKGAQAVIIGRSDIVGKPMALLLLHRHATITICHSRTVDLPGVARKADILAVAIGRPEMVNAEYVKPGAVVIDFGTNEVGDTLVGDVKFDEVKPIAGYISPVPGGTGSVTTAMLLQNLLNAVEYRLHLPLTH